MRIRVADGTGIFFTAATNRPWQPGGPTLLGLHGGPGIDGSQMRYFLGPAQEWATVVVPDQRGHGRSDRSEPGKWTLAQWAEDARDLVDRAGLEDVILVGTSFGGFVAQHFLAANPGVTRGGVIVGSSPRRASVEQIVERYREVGGDEAADVMRRTMAEPAPRSRRSGPGYVRRCRGSARRTRNWAASSVSGSTRRRSTRISWTCSATSTCAPTSPPRPIRCSCWWGKGPTDAARGRDRDREARHRGRRGRPCRRGRQPPGAVGPAESRTRPDPRVRPFGHR